MEEPAKTAQCATCGRDLDPEDAAVVWVVAGRGRLVGEWDVEHSFEEEQVRVFCDLDHANAHLREHPLADRFTDTTVGDHDGPGRLADVGCFAVLLIVLTFLVVGGITSIGWLLGLL
ncbi:MAG: hypothetical protein PGN07_00785 [Aeromicrobium erythreum]